MMHYHFCPECKEKYNCEQDCTLRDASNQLGVNIVCHLCEVVDEPPQEEQTEIIFKVEPQPVMTPEEWDRYNGFIK
jgi:hypothetical protein